jgi:hypothetical protein
VAARAPAALRHGEAPRQVWGAFFLSRTPPPERLCTVQDVRRIFALRWDWGVHAPRGGLLRQAQRGTEESLHITLHLRVCTADLFADVGGLGFPPDAQRP